MKKKSIVISLIFTAIAAVIAFLNLQTDDEIYIGAFDYVNAPEDADYDGGVITVREDMGMAAGSVIAEIAAMHVDSGSYIIDTDHQGDSNIEVVVCDGATEIDRYELPQSETNTRHSFSSDRNLYNLSIKFLYNGEGTATLKRSIVYSDSGPFYSDTIVYAVLIVVAIFLLAYLFSRYSILNMPIKDRICIMAVLLYLILINYMYYRPFPLDVEDTGYHVARIEATYNEMRQGQIPIVLYSDFIQGRGMIGIMYPYLFLLFPAVLRAIHMSPEGAIRLFFIFITYATCATSYIASRKLIKNRYVAAASMMLYGMLVYRINTMTYRYAYGELQAFIFFPLIIWGLYETLIGDKRKWPVLALGMTGLLQCHLISFIQAVIVCIVFGVIYSVRAVRERRIVQIVSAALTTFLLNLWYIVPFMTYYREDLGIHDHMSWGNNIYVFADYLTEMIRLFPNTSEGETQHKMGIIGLWLVIMAVISIYFQLKKEKREDKDNFSLVLLIIGAAALFMASKTFPWETLLKFDMVSNSFSYLQFVGRFYMTGEVFLFFGSVLTLAELPMDKNEAVSPGGFLRTGFTACIIALAAFQAYAVSDSWLAKRTNPFIDKTVARYTAGVNDTTVEDYVPAGYWFGEGFNESAYSPVAKITDYDHSHLDTTFVYSAESPTYVEIPILYYKGYRAVDENGNVLPLEKGDAGSIRVSVPGSSNKIRVDISFIRPAVWLYALIISLISAGGFVVLWIRMFIKSKERSGQNEK